MTRFVKSSHLRIIGFAAGAAAVSGAAVLVTASAAGFNVGFRHSSSQPAQITAATVAQKANSAAICDKFVSHVFTNLGV